MCVCLFARLSLSLCSIVRVRGLVTSRNIFKFGRSNHKKQNWFSA